VRELQPFYLQKKLRKLLVDCLKDAARDVAATTAGTRDPVSWKRFKLLVTSCWKVPQEYHPDGAKTGVLLYDAAAFPKEAGVASLYKVLTAPVDAV
jgi:hypothetical protein